MNDRALHICLVGNFDKVPPSDAMVKVAIERAIAPWRMVYGIPVERVIGHRDFNPAKTCPGTMFDLELLREMLR
jgi:N-acetyl-anhydromuramyl-L-alanine amidase AmpD